MNFTFEMNS